MSTKSDITKNVFPMTESYLSFNLKVLAALGIWNPYEKGLNHWLYQCYWSYVVMVILLMRTLSILMPIIAAPNAAVFIREFSLLAVEVSDCLKYLAFALHRNRVFEISDMFHWERHLSCTREITKYRNAVITDALGASKTFNIAIVIAVVQYYGLYYYFALSYSGHKVDNLPIKTIPMKYCFILSNFWVAFICDYVSNTWRGLLAVCHDSFIMALMIHITAQLRILNFRLERCHLTAYTINNDDESDANVGKISTECVKRKGNKWVDLDPNAELINCIRFHQQIVNMLNIFKDMYHKVLLPQLLTSLLCITISVLQMILDEHENLTESIIAGVFVVAVVLQLLAFCWGGNFILVESDKTCNALYASEWYSRDRVFRTNVKILLGAVRSPLVVSAGGLVDLSAETFKNILTKGYSGAAVLKNARN